MCYHANAILYCETFYFHTRVSILTMSFNSFQLIPYKYFCLFKVNFFVNKFYLLHLFVYLLFGKTGVSISLYHTFVDIPALVNYRWSWRRNYLSMELGLIKHKKQLLALNVTWSKPIFYLWKWTENLFQFFYKVLSLRNFILDFKNCGDLPIILYVAI